MKRSSTDCGDKTGEQPSRQRGGAITFRPVCPGDEGFLSEVYASTRLDELGPLGWTPTQQQAFLRMQFTAQHRSYLAQFPAADFLIVLWHGRPVGRLYLERRADEIRGIDIALLPEYRGVGIGTAVLRDLLAEAARAGKPFRLHVAKSNWARRLYERLGFCTLEDDGVYLFMEWSPGRR